MSEVQYTFCPLTTNQRALLRSQIDAGAWKHSWHLPSDPNGYIDWNSIDSMIAIRDVLVDQITEAKNQLREADRCLNIVVGALMRMESDAKASCDE